MNEYERFTSMVSEALNNIPQLYYCTVYKNINSFRAAFAGKQGVLNDDTFERYGERVFCYEFYHQLRKLIDKERIGKNDFLTGANLQGEVDKMQLIKLVENLGLDPLSGRFVPDFLMHSAGDASNHAFVMEVKCVNELTRSAFITDIKKINQFIVKYQYKRGLFISVNTNPEHIEKLIKENQKRLNAMDGKESIRIINKQNHEQEPIIYTI